MCVSVTVLEDMFCLRRTKESVRLNFKCLVLAVTDPDSSQCPSCGAGRLKAACLILYLIDSMKDCYSFIRPSEFALEDARGQSFSTGKHQRVILVCIGSMNVVCLVDCAVNIERVIQRYKMGLRDDAQKGL